MPLWRAISSMDAARKPCSPKTSSAASSIFSSRSARGMRVLLTDSQLTTQGRNARTMPFGREAHRLGELLQRDRLLPAEVGGLAQDRLRHRGHVVGQARDPLAPL